MGCGEPNQGILGIPETKACLILKLPAFPALTRAYRSALERALENTMGTPC